MARKKIRSESFDLESILPIDITKPKTYVLANIMFDAKQWARVFTTKNDQMVVARIKQPRPLSRQIELQIETQKKITNEDIEEIIGKIRFELGLDEKMQILRIMRDVDPLVEIAIRSLPGFRIFANSNIQEAAILTMISQNTSFFNYLKTVKLFFDTFGVKVPWDKSLRGFPDNQTIANITPEEWSHLNIGYKAKFLSALTESDLEKMEVFVHYPVIERGLKGLLKIKGIGPYTARCLLIYAARRYQYAFYDAYVAEVLEHKYELSTVTTMNEYDEWIEQRWPKDPALILHTLLLDYLPAYLQTHNYDL
ncbi:MAG: hypothetical protein ACXAD7_13710 [Candidatus Kariarchaeaceae archaeon]|jgi:3-methyladenine DNA glycosylase/8-oxoguanine DNA glycosylase